MQSNNTENEDQGQNQHNHGINLQAGRLIRVQLCNSLVHAHSSKRPIIWSMHPELRG